MIYIFFRIAAFFIATNGIFPNGTPNIFKVNFSVLLAVMIGGNVESGAQIGNLYEFIGLGIGETINGLVLGYIVNICFYSLKLAGKLIDNQLGLAMASTYDPNTQSQATIMENLMYFIGVLVFFGVNAHHILINSIQESFNIIPIGYSVLDQNLEYIIKVFSEYFIIGMKIATPIILILIITDLITGIISRSISGLNVMVIGMPLKMLVGIIFILGALPFILTEVQEIFKGLINVLDGTMALNDVSITMTSVFF